MKKVGKILLNVLLATTLVACGSSETGSVSSGETSSATLQPLEQSAATGNTGSAISLKESSIEATTLYSEDGIEIVADSLDFSGNSPALNFEFINNSDQEITISTSGRLIVNHYMTPGYASETVDAGKKAKSDLYLDASELALAGITQINDIQVSFEIEIGDDWQNPKKVGPFEIQTSSYGGEDRAYTMADIMQGNVSNEDSYVTGTYVDTTTLFDQNGVTVDTVALATSIYDSDYVLVHIKNDTEQTVTFGAYDVEINDIAVTYDLWSNQEIAPGCDAIEEYPMEYFLNDGASLLVENDSVGKVSFMGIVKDTDLNELSRQQIDFIIKDYSVNTDGEIIYNDDTVQVIYKGNMSDSLDGLHFVYLIQNKSDKTICSSVDYGSVYINGYGTSSLTGAMNVATGKYGMLDVDISSLYFDDSGIASMDDVESLEFTIEINDESGYQTIKSIPVTLSLVAE